MRFESTVSPQNIIVASVNPASLRVSWQPSPIQKQIFGYVILYTRVETSNTMRINVISETTHIISGLVAFTKYSVKVAALTVNGIDPPSNPVIQESGEDGKSLNL